MKALLAAVATLLLVSACGPVPEASSPSAGPGGPVAAPVAPADEAGLRAAASRALADQRLYAPAGDNAIEHYLALHALLPREAGVETALLELLPYAVIGSEQAIARGDFDEARRLLGLVERADAAFPALSRLRDRLAVAEADARDAAERAARETEDTAQREQAARLAAEAITAPRVAAASAVAPPERSEPGTEKPAAVPAPREPVAAPPVVAAPPAAAPRVPRVVDAPQPRYPLMAMRRKIEGDVVLELRIEPDGRVGQARVISAEPAGLFDEAAVAAASRWRFESGPGVVTTRQVMRFRLPKAG